MHRFGADPQGSPDPLGAIEFGLLRTWTLDFGVQKPNFTK